jgi:1-acyl-sn-glycerol-3-phosphate acyltransferase
LKLFLAVRQWFYTVFSFCCFLCLAVELTVAGFFILTIGGSTEEHKKKYHRLLQRRTRFVISHIPGTTFSYTNPVGETFEKPAVIISNHQSHLDLAAIMMLTPNLVILTKDWVWHNPFYGIIIRYADYLPVSDMEQMLPKLSALVEKGYSVMVFPEGTRSPNCKIQRFHRGAFYLAEQLKLDILPVFIDGFGKVLPKTSFHLHPGEMTLEVMPRVAHDDPLQGDYRETARKLHRVYLEKKR